MRILSLLLSVCVVVAVWWLVPAVADEEPAAKAKEPTLKDLAWMVGAWQEAEGPSVFSETWMPAQGEAMAGVAHWTIQGRTRMYELTVIEQTADGIVIHVRHFGAGLVPWASEAKGPITWPLKSLKGQHAVFEHPTRAWPKRLEYKRDADTMQARLTGTEGGKPKVIPIAFRLRR